MRRDLLHSIAEEKDVTNAIILTHNIDFVFVQTVVLSAFRRCGHPSLTILADAGCATESFAIQAPLLNGIGIRYRVVPVEMAPGFRFHPKALLLSGPKSATLYVGSGNLTFGGWRENAEIWMRFCTEPDGTGPFTAFFNYFLELLDLIAIPDPVRTAIEEAYDAKTHEWAANLREPEGVFGKAVNGPALLDQILAHIRDGKPEKISILAPYFDNEGIALREIAHRTGVPNIDVLVQPKRTGLTESAWENIDPGMRLMPISFVRTDEHERSREVFIHAKMYAFEQAGRVIVFSGSPNCSQAAMLIPGRAGNAELVAFREMSIEEFQADFLNELVSKDDPGLALQPNTFSTPKVPALRIRGANFDGGYLRVAYASNGWHIEKCFVDGIEMPYKMINDDILIISCEKDPSRVVLEGSDGIARERSNTGWVDHEWELRATARGRSAADTIRRRVRSSEWGLGAWSEIFDVFCSHLKYLPPRFTVGRPTDTSKRGNMASLVEYTSNDVFLSDFSLPSPQALIVASSPRDNERIDSLQKLLLRWFGLAIMDDLEATPTIPISAPNKILSEGDTVDVPEDLPTINRQSTTQPSNSINIRRIKKLVILMTETMTSEDFRHERPPDFLAADLKVASVLLRVALLQSWIDQNDFFEATYKIWDPLFLDVDGDGRGWLQLRYEASSTQKDFITALRTPDFLAALIAWAVVVPKEARSPEHARFRLASALAIARFPWLWDGINEHEVCRELAVLLINTSNSENKPAISENNIDMLWLEFMQRGYALRLLENALVGQSPAGLSPKVQNKQVAKGDLIWQGTAGFCVVTEDASREAGFITALSLRSRTSQSTAGIKSVKLNRHRGKSASAMPQDKTAAIKFITSHVVPLIGVLDEAVLPLTNTFGPAPRSILRAFARELAEGFAQHVS